MRKIEANELLDDQDIEILKVLYNNLMLNNALVTLSQKAHKGDVIVTFNDPSIKTLNTEIGRPEEQPPLW